MSDHRLLGGRKVEDVFFELRTHHSTGSGNVLTLLLLRNIIIYGGKKSISVFMPTILMREKWGRRPLLQWRQVREERKNGLDIFLRLEDAKRSSCTKKEEDNATLAKSTSNLHKIRTATQTSSMRSNIESKITPPRPRQLRRAKPFAFEPESTTEYRIAVLFGMKITEEPSTHI
ncbi:hypothetical protein PROFUN_01310 [Planoprotostelium fungivorum]|uniref:Uncharacterized protein n=1 Tax=Planoprotostelium fungivorum TaxID=1890364 RepID=A0A2P6NZT1_9EUKA|nr:hypothetical protein PROFUN_01310 [Planoprotostelium fungivorum]